MTDKSRRAGSPQAATHKELAQRIGSAIVLAVLALLLTFAGLWPFTLMIGSGGIILAWEWGRLVRGAAFDAAFWIHAVVVVAACVLVATAEIWFAFFALLLGAGGCAVLTSTPDRRLWSALGVLYVGLPALLLVLFRSDATYGLTVILFLFLLVWTADTAAYFSGRTLRGPKLAPKISPGKTWSGFFGGLVVPTLLAYGFALWLGGTSAVALALTGAALVIACQIGDLAESAIKRTYRVKNAGDLLPGHGGLLDRVDGLIGATLAAGCIAGTRDLANAGNALLIWP